jgi:YVTN family beta-propeller protein
VSGARIQNVAVSRDGATLFATDIQRSKLLAWALTAGSATPQEYAIGTPVSRNAFDVAITPDNTQVYVSTLADGEIFVLDRVTRTLIGTMATGGNPRYIAFNDSGTVAVIPNEQGWVNFTPPPDVCGAPPAGVAPPGGSHPSLTSNVTVPLTGTPFAVAISPAGVTYVTQSLSASVARADLPSTSFSTSFPVGNLPSQVRMSPDGRTAYVENQDAQTITFIDVASNQVIATLAVPSGSILNMGLSPDGRRLYALTDYAGVQIVDTQTRVVVGSIPPEATGSLLTGVAFHPFAPCMYLAARDEGRITTVNLRTNAVVRSQTVFGGRIQNVAVSRDGALLFATDIQRSMLLVRDLSSDGSAFLEYAVGAPQSRNAFDVAVTPDNAQVYVSTLADGKVYVLDRATRALRATVVTGGSARYVSFTATGTTAVIANESGWVNFVH